MKLVTKMGAQGDVILRKVAKLPDGVTEVPRKGGEPIIVTHSETGHHHVVRQQHVRMYATKDPLIAYLVVAKDIETKARKAMQKKTARTAKAKAEVEPAHADVEHLRPYDTHETLRLDAGVWEIRRQRERVPEGWRQVQD